MSGRSDRLKFAVGRASLSGPKSHQARIRAGAIRLVSALRDAKMGVQLWERMTNRHYQVAANQMRREGLGYGRIAEVFSCARHVCLAYGNTRISRSNAEFGVVRGDIANATSKAIAPEKVQQVIHDLEHTDTYTHAPRIAAQIRLQYELGLRREEAAKVDLINDWSIEDRTLYIQHGPKGGRPRMIKNLSEAQEHALAQALPFVSRTDRPGIYNLMPQGMGDRWQNCLSYAARKHGLTKKACGYTLHGNRHERFRQEYLRIAGFEPPNCFPTLLDFHRKAMCTVGLAWREKDSQARDHIEQLAGHSAGRRDISSAYLGRSH